MTDTSRRDLLTGAAGLAAGSVLALPAPVRAEEVPLKIEPSARYLEIRSLQKNWLRSMLWSRATTPHLPKTGTGSWRSSRAFHTDQQA